jgi:hypothetical protein
MLKRTGVAHRANTRTRVGNLQAATHSNALSLKSDVNQKPV